MERMALRFQHPQTLATTTLSLFQTARQVVVAWRLPAGETSGDVPEVFRCLTEVAAQEKFFEVRRQLLRRGYLINGRPA